MLAYRALLHPLYVSLFFYYLFIVNQVWFQYHLSISLTFSLNWFISINCCYLFAYNFIIRQCFHSVLPPWDQGGGNDFCVISQAVGATAKLQEPEWGHIQGGGDDFRQSSRGGLFYPDELLIFPQNALPWILQISPVALSYVLLDY